MRTILLENTRTWIPIVGGEHGGGLFYPYGDLDHGDSCNIPSRSGHYVYLGDVIQHFPRPVQEKQKAIDPERLARLAEARRKVAEDYARESGWPETLKPSQVATMNALATAAAPMLASEFESKTKSSPITVAKNLRELCSLGLARKVRVGPLTAYVLGLAAILLIQKRRSHASANQ